MYRRKLLVHKMKTSTLRRFFQAYIVGACKLLYFKNGTWIFWKILLRKSGYCTMMCVISRSWFRNVLKEFKLYEYLCWTFNICAKMLPIWFQRSKSKLPLHRHPWHLSLSLHHVSTLQSPYKVQIKSSECTNGVHMKHSDYPFI